MEGHILLIQNFLFIFIGQRFICDKAVGKDKACKSDVWLTVHRNSVWIKKTNQMSLFVFFISLLIVAQHVSGNHVPIIRN